MCRWRLARSSLVPLMSVPFSTVCCTGCDLAQPGFILFGDFRYSDQGREAPVNRGFGYCKSCRSVEPREVLPGPDDIAQEDALENIKPPAGLLSRLRSLISRRSGDTQPSPRNDSSTILRIVAGLNRAPVCLTCGSSDGIEIPRSSAEGSDAQGAHTGVIHPGCGGKFLIRPSDGLRVALRPRIRIYDLYGKLLDDHPT